MVALKCKYTWILSIFYIKIDVCIDMYSMNVCIFYIRAHGVYIFKDTIWICICSIKMQQYVCGNLDFKSYPSRC